MKKCIAVLALIVSAGFATASLPEIGPNITITGNGKVVYVPDLGYIQVGVSAEGWTAAEAWKKNEAIVRKIFDELKKLGVEDKDLRTENLSVQPKYQQKPKQEPKFVGYTVSYDLRVTVRKLDQMGALLDSMVDAGANRSMNISFGCSNADEFLDQARVKAVADARKKANLYVIGAGAKLGDVLAISDVPYNLQSRLYPVDAMALREGHASLPIAAGEQVMSITLTVTWGIDNSRLEPHFTARPSGSAGIVSVN